MVMNCLECRPSNIIVISKHTLNCYDYNYDQSNNNNSLLIVNDDKLNDKVCNAYHVMTTMALNDNRLSTASHSI